MVTLPQTLSNWLCHSVSPVRSKVTQHKNTMWATRSLLIVCWSICSNGEPISEHDTYQNSQHPFSANKFAVAKQLPGVTNYCFKDAIRVWQTLRGVTVIVRAWNQVSILYMSLLSPLPIHLSALLPCFWGCDTQVVAHSPCPCFGWLQLWHLLTNCFLGKKDKAMWAIGTPCLDFPWTTILSQHQWWASACQQKADNNKTHHLALSHLWLYYMVQLMSNTKL